MKKYIFICLLSFVSFVSAFAQKETDSPNTEVNTTKKNTTIKANMGVVYGKVVDEKTGELLSGISVTIDGMNISSSTDGSGKFILNLKPGVYTLIFKNTSYKTKEEANIEVKVGEETNINIVLEPATVELAGATVKGKGKKETASAMLVQQKNASAVSDGVSIESIRKTPDRTTADVMKRVSGASVQDGKFVIIRGLNDRYNSAYINGSPLPSTEADKKAFSFDLIPSIMIDQITISKTATPDKTGEFAGGLVEITTRDIPEKKFVQFQYGTNYHSISTFNNYQSYQGGKTDWLGFDNGTRKLSSSFASSTDYSKANINTQIEQSKLLGNDWGIQNHSSVMPGNNFSVIGGMPYKIGKKEAGFFVGLTYSNQNRIILAERNDYDQQGLIFNYKDTGYKSSITGGLIFNTSVKLAQGHKISFKNTLNINSDDQTILRNGVDYSSGNYIKSYAFIYNQNMFTSSQLTGDHVLLKKKIKFNWNVGYSYINRQTPDYRRLRYTLPTPENQDPDNPQTEWQAVVTPSASPNDGGRFYSKLKEHIWSSSVNFTKSLVIKSTRIDFKSGLSFIDRSRDFSARVLGYITNPQFNYNLAKLGIGEIFAQENMNIKGFRLSESTNPSDQYTASSRLFAAYTMADQRLTDDLRLIYGVRVEHFQQQLHSRDYTNKPIEINTKKTDFLPSINVCYSINKKTNIRMAASQTVSRPEFRELAPFGFFDFNQFVSMQGNSSLQRSLIQNYDLRYETYPKDGEVFSVSAFYKNFINPIEIVLDPAIGGGTRSMSYKNIAKATGYGLELEYRKRLPALSFARWTKHITFSTNMSYIVSRVDVSNLVGSGRKYRPLQGQSPYIVNGALSFQNKGWSFNAAYNVVGPRLSNVGTANYLEYYEKPRHIIDLQFGKSLLKDKMDIKLNVADLLAQNLVFYQPVSVKSGETIDIKNTRPINTFYNGRSITLSLSWKL
ncbi:MAG: TonB-dependent receptor [Bacteroidetes bacterium]|nr:TonB-dependent receptor [Bacteroidota bacterium]